jgi:hypothetical protein
MGPKTFQRRPSFSVANAEKIPILCYFYTVRQSRGVYGWPTNIISCINIQIIWYCERKLPVRINKLQSWTWRLRPLTEILLNELIKVHKKFHLCPTTSYHSHEPYWYTNYTDVVESVVNKSYTSSPVQCCEQPVHEKIVCVIHHYEKFV